MVRRKKEKDVIFQQSLSPLHKEIKAGDSQLALPFFLMH
jgi:hypothetical protein